MIYFRYENLSEHLCLKLFNKPSENKSSFSNKACKRTYYYPNADFCKNHKLILVRISNYLKSNNTIKNTWTLFTIGLSVAHPETKKCISVKFYCLIFLIYDLV